MLTFAHETDAHNEPGHGDVNIRTRRQMGVTNQVTEMLTFAHKTDGRNEPGHRDVNIRTRERWA